MLLNECKMLLLSCTIKRYGEVKMLGFSEMGDVGTVYYKMYNSPRYCIVLIYKEESRSLLFSP